MKFHDFLSRRLKRGGPDTLVLIRLHGRTRKLDVVKNWPELRAWLRKVGARQDEMPVAEAAWRAYRRYLASVDTAMPQEPLKPLSPPPGGSGAVTDAEPLTRLRDLGYQPRKIARQIDPATWEWFGDLNDIVERRKYLIMLWDHGSVTQLTHFPDERRMPLVFARVRHPIAPAAAYKAASDPVEASVKQHPMWLVRAQPYVGLGAIR
jgi:hypothetical protein